MIRYCLIGCLLAMVAPAFAMAQEESRRIVVRATGEVTVPADELRLPLELRTVGDDLAAVKLRNDQLLKQILELVASHKLTLPAIESTSMSFDFSPEESADRFGSPKGQLQQVPGGKGIDPFDAPREASPPLHMIRRMTLKFADLAQATEFLVKLTPMDAVRKTSEVRLSPLQAVVKELGLHQRVARRMAVQRCKEKAALLADASDLQLGGAVEIFDESSSLYPRADLHDPFGSFGLPSSPPGDGGQGSLAFVFFQAEKEKTQVDPEMLPPAQINISVTIRIIYESTLAKQ